MASAADGVRASLASLSSPEARAMVEWRLRFLDDPKFNPKQLVDFSRIKQDKLFFHPGRGWGKNVTGVNWICWDLCRETMFGHVIAPTHNDLRYVIFEGESGIIRWVPPILIRSYNSSDMVIEFYNGSVLRGFSAEKPERLRGPQCARLWCDELAAWLRMRETYEQALFGLRLSDRPLTVITSTPQPKELVRELMEDPHVLKIGGHQSENKHLPPAYLEQMRRLSGTRLGRQELAGELLDAEEFGVIPRSQWKRYAHNQPLPAFEIIIMSLDTALGEENVDVKKQKTDYTACTVWGGWHEKPKDEPDLERLVRPEGDIVLPKRDARILLLDAWAERLGFPDLIKRIKKEKEQRYGNDTTIFRPALGDYFPTGIGRKPDLILIEDKNSGISARQQLRSEGIPVQPYDPADQNKYLRLNLCAPVFVGGYVYAVTSESRPNEFKGWAEPVVAQMCSYSGEGSLEHDDLMDSATQALLWLQRNWLHIAPPVHTRRGIIRTPAGQNPYAS